MLPLRLGCNLKCWYLQCACSDWLRSSEKARWNRQIGCVLQRRQDGTDRLAAFFREGKMEQTDTHMQPNMSGAHGSIISTWKHKGTQLRVTRYLRAFRLHCDCNNFGGEGEFIELQNCLVSP